MIPIHENNEKLEALNPDEFFCESSYFKQGYIDSSTILVRAGVIGKLRSAQEKLRAIGNYSLKIFDGFRSIKLQEKMHNQTYEKFKTENPTLNAQQLRELTHKYWAFPDKNPLSPPPHNTGGAVDLTIIDENKNELPMGAPFDDTTEKAATNYFSNNGKTEENAETYNKNRLLLKRVMEESGFKNYPEEWWHYNFGNQEWVEYKGGDKAIYGSAEQ
jgi:D-alanyl-D-alanine dipeptidase